MKKRLMETKIISEWKKGRKKFWEDRGIDIREIEEGRSQKERIFEDVIWKDKEEQRKERWENIREAKSCRWYKEVKGEGIPEYLKKGWGENRWKRIARWRMGNEIKEGRYWKETRKKICGREEETWEHVWERCRRWEEWGGR